MTATRMGGHRKPFQKTVVYLLAALLSTVAVGCWDLIDINKKTLITTLAFDFKDDQIVFHAEIANFESGQSEEGTSGGQRYSIVTACGKTLPEVRANLEEKVNQPIYLSGVRALIFTERFANKYMYEYLYRMRADEEYRKKAMTFVTREDPEALFEIAGENNVSLGMYIEEIVETMESAGGTFKRTTSRILENLSNANPVFLLHCIGVRQEHITFTEYAVYSHQRIAGFLSTKDAGGVLLFKTDHAESVYLVPYKEIQFTVRTEMKKRKIEPRYEDGRIAFDLKFEFDAGLLYGDKKTPYGLDDAAAKEMQGILAEMIKKDIIEAVMRAQKEFGCDYLQLHDAFRIKYPAVFKSLDWSQVFPSAEVYVAVKVRLESSWDLDYSVTEAK